MKSLTTFNANPLAPPKLVMNVERDQAAMLELVIASVVDGMGDVLHQRLYVVTHCDAKPKLEEPIKDPARFDWHEVKKVEHYRLEVNALTTPITLKDDEAPYKSA